MLVVGEDEINSKQVKELIDAAGYYVDIDSSDRTIQNKVTSLKLLYGFGGIANYGVQFANCSAFWRRYELKTTRLSQELEEQLRLIMEPTLASKLQGDYKTRKRINMKKWLILADVNTDSLVNKDVSSNNKTGSDVKSDEQPMLYNFETKTEASAETSFETTFIQSFLDTLTEHNPLISTSNRVQVKLGRSSLRNYVEVWDMSFQVVAAMFDNLGKFSPYFFKGAVKSLEDLQSCQMKIFLARNRQLKDLHVKCRVFGLLCADVTMKFIMSLSSSLVVYHGKQIVQLKKSLVKAEKYAAKAQAALDGAESKLMLVDGEPVVGENPASLRRLKLDATKTKDEEYLLALFLCHYKSFSNVLLERLHDTFGENSLEPIGDSEAMAVDGDDTHAMETDKENGGSERNAGTRYIIGEKEQWCLSTLGYFKAFSRQYASEVLLSLKAGGVGLTAASNVFLMDPWWNPAVEEQAIMRIHRIGQKRTVCVRRFIVMVKMIQLRLADTVEERMQQVQVRKQQMIAGALTD
ncbi:nuclear cap-binding protein subunit 1 [Tanacetum coccineum]